MIRGLYVSKVLPILALSYVFIGGFGSEGTDGGTQPHKNEYPMVRRDEHVCDTYAGHTTVKDAYRWLEVTNSTETKNSFIKEENGFSRTYLDKVPDRAKVGSRYRELYPFASWDNFAQVGSKYFSFQYPGLATTEPRVLYIHDSPTAEGKVFLDPNTWRKNGIVYLDYYSSVFSRDGLILAYLVDPTNSGWREIKFKHVEKGDIYKDTLTKVKYTGIAFNGDKGIFYSGYLDHEGKLDDTDNGPLKHHKLHYHKLGTEQSEDIVVAKFPQRPDSSVYAFAVGQGRYLIVYSQGNPDEGGRFAYVADLAKINYEIKGTLTLLPIFDKEEKNHMHVVAYNNTFIFSTDQDAENFKLVSFNITDNHIGKMTDLVPEDKKRCLDSALPVYKDYLLLCYREDAKHVLQLHCMHSGKLIKKFENMEIGTIKSFGVDEELPNFYFVLETFVSSSIVYHCDLSAPYFDLKILREDNTKNFKRENFKTEQVSVKSKDGTHFPMFIVHKNGLDKHENNPVLIINNGADGTDEKNTPYFGANRLMFLSNFNGICVFVQNRGGMEYDEAWHQNGVLHNKHKAIEDVIAAAEYMIAEKYTRRDLIIAYGEKHGGTIMAACINQRPDLFGVAVIKSGMFDMLRYDQFSDGAADTYLTTIGSPHNNTDFESIFAYSPLHNIKMTAQYPAILLLSSAEDDVSVAHSFKYMATLQFETKAHCDQKKPFIITIDMTTTDEIDKMDDKAKLKRIAAKYEDMYSFIMENTKIKFQPSC